MFLYRQLADDLEASIAKGVLRPGDALPSVRAMCKREKISPATVIEAYARLEAKGLVMARPKSGFYVLRLPSLLPEEPVISDPSLTPTAVHVGEMVADMLSPRRNLGKVALGAAVPALELLPTHAVLRHYARALRMGASACAYDLPPGNALLRRQIALRALQWGHGLDPEALVLTSGCLEALTLALRAVAGPGDLVAIESPTYFALLQAMENLGMRAVEIPTHPRTGIDLGGLAKVMRRHPLKACLFAPNFNNPLGSLMPEENKRQLVDMLAKRNLPLIEDDIYGDLHFGGQRPKPAKAFDKKGLVLYCASFSKTLDPGGRVGWVSPGRFRDKVIRLKLMNTLAAATVPQAALASYLETGSYEKHLRRLRIALEDQVSAMVAAVQNHFPSGTRMTRPQGGFTLWVEMPRKIAALKLAEAANRHGISLAPGPIFSPRGRFEHFIRLSCGNLWSEGLEKAVATLGRLANAYL